MTYMEGVYVTAQATFGRDGAMFEGLLGFVAQMSVVLWSLVILTVVIRFVGIRIYRRGAGRTAPVATAARSAAVPTAVAPGVAVPTTAAAIDLIQPDAGRWTDAGLDRTDLTTDAITNATFDNAGQPAAVAATVKAPRHAHRKRRAESRSASHMPTLAANAPEP